MSDVIRAFTWPILATNAYFLMYYVLLLVQRQVKHRLRAEYRVRGEVFDRYWGHDARMLAADRSTGNTHEQQGPFVAAMWLHAIFVNPNVAGVLGLIYVVARACYPLLLGKELLRVNSKRVYLSTLPSYAVVFYLLGSTLFVSLGVD